MNKTIAASMALTIASFGLATGVSALTCNEISEGEVIPFTLTEENTEKAVDKACPGSGRDDQEIASFSQGFDSRPGNRNAAQRRAASPAAGGFGSGGGGGSNSAANTECIALDPGEDGVNICIETVSTLFLDEQNEGPLAVPLPAAGGMLVAALGGLALMRRRRKV